MPSKLFHHYHVSPTNREPGEIFQLCYYCAVHHDAFKHQTDWVTHVDPLEHRCIKSSLRFSKWRFQLVTYATFPRTGQIVPKPVSLASNEYISFFIYAMMKQVGRTPDCRQDTNKYLLLAQCGLKIQHDFYVFFDSILNLGDYIYLRRRPQFHLVVRRLAKNSCNKLWFCKPGLGKVAVCDE